MRAAGWCSIPTRAQGGALEATTPGTLADQKPLTRPLQLCRGVIDVDARCDAARERVAVKGSPPPTGLANSKTLSSKGV